MKKAYTPKTPCKQKTVNKDSLQVYCRLKPNPTPELSCINVISNTTVQLTVQDAANNIKTGSCKQYTFKRIFTETSTQKEVFDDVALPLVEQLVRGKNGLLFTYGVTGSGKTYAMTGNKQNVGIMPRCLDVLFNSINDFQSQRYVFKPDRMNGFEVQTEEEAKRDREDSLRRNNIHKLRKKESQEDLLSARSKDGTTVAVAEEDNAYAVFITYIEVYNNYVYDLLDCTDQDICSKPQSKLIREDGAGNMYIHGITEVEVKSTEEAFEMFYKGQKRKRMAHTSLNTDSSRSHSIFTIRLVQAPLDAKGETVMQDKQMICISQLSLVDLAGSERTNRTKNTGQRLNEASKINQSLMVLRKCFETLRENQQTNANRMVAYREQRITHLFKNFFEGDGDIRMIVCVNPSIADADENVLVMQFAEASQDIMVKSTPMKADYGIGLTPGRRRANQAFKKTLQMAEEIREQLPSCYTINEDRENHVYVPNDTNLIYHLPPCPQREQFQSDEEYDKKLKEYLVDTKRKIIQYRADLLKKAADFRAAMAKEQEQYHMILRERDTLNARIESEQTKRQTLEKNFFSADSSSNLLKRKLEELAEENRRLKCNNNSLKRKCEEYSEEVKKIKKRGPVTSETTSAQNVVSPSKSTSTAVSNPRYGKTHCNDHDQWLDHRPAQVTPMNTVLQPVLRKRKSFDKVTSPKDVRKTSKYCLMNQNQNEDGDLETQFYKGDVIPTSGGGAQIILNDVETLKQSSPLKSPTSPRKQTGLYPDIEARCSMAVEGHSLRRKC